MDIGGYHKLKEERPIKYFFGYWFLGYPWVEKGDRAEYY